MASHFLGPSPPASTKTFLPAAQESSTEPTPLLLLLLPPSQRWLAPLALLLLVVYLTLTRLHTWRRLAAFPGPRLAAISYLPMLRLRLGRAGPHVAPRAYAALSHRYGAHAPGGLVRIGPHDLLAADPAHLRRMSAVRSPYERSSWYEATRLDPYHDMMGSVRDKAAHGRLRARLAAGYTGRDNPHLAAEIRSQVQALVELIQRRYLTPDPSTAAAAAAEGVIIPVHFGRLADFYAHDAKSMLAFGRPLGMLAQDRDVHGIVAIVKLALDWIQIFTDIPPLRTIFLSNTVLQWLGPKPTDRFGVGKLMGMARDLVAARLRPGAQDRQDLLGSFLKHGLDKRSAEAEVMFPIIAGADTTATAIKMMVAYVAAHPAVAHRLQTEIQEAIATGRLSDSAPGPSATTCTPQAEAWTALPYLQAVLWEGLRIHPPFGGLIMKAVGPEGDVLHGGTFLPPGTRVGHSTWAVMRDPAVFGADVDCFRPERWLEVGEKQRGLMQRQTDLVFGSGRWGCPGRTVAFLEMNAVVVELFRRFDFQLITGTRPLSKKEKEQFLEGSLPVVITRTKLES